MSNDQDGVTFTVGQVVAVLHADHVDHLPRIRQLLDRHLRQPEMPDLAFRLQLRRRTKLALERHRRIDPVQLQQVDPFELHSPQRQLRRLPQVLRSPQRRWAQTVTERINRSGADLGLLFDLIDPRVWYLADFLTQPPQTARPT